MSELVFNFPGFFFPHISSGKVNTGNATSYYSSFQRVVITAAVGPN